VRQKLLFIRINLLDTYNRKKMPRSLEFTDFERGMIIGLHLGEWHSFSEIAVILKCFKGAVQGVIERYKEDERTTVQPRSGRPQKLSDRDERQLIRVTKKDRSATLDQITEEFNRSLTISASKRTVQRTLHYYGFYSRVAKRKPLVSEKNKKDRVLRKGLEGGMGQGNFQ
jgi:transposase